VQDRVNAAGLQVTERKVPDGDDIEFHAISPVLRNKAVKGLRSTCAFAIAKETLLSMLP